MKLKIVSAGAGSGKTFRLMTEMVNLLKSGTVQPEGIIATTFTKKAAAELEERVRIRLLEEGLPDLADRLTGALIGTVHGLGVKLLKRFCFEAGVSPNVDIIADEDQRIFFNQSLATILTKERVEKMEILTKKMGLRKPSYGPAYDWRQDLKDIVDRARVNGFDLEKIQQSKLKSFSTLQAFLPTPSPQTKAYFTERLQSLLQDTLSALQDNDADSTKATSTAKSNIQKYLNILQKGDELIWQDWVSIAKLKTGAKSKDLIEELQEFALNHDQHPDFQKDIKAFIEQMFDIAVYAIEEYEKFKQKRGLIDYIDMETHVKRLLDNSAVHEVLKDEIDLLMVDEFQDTSPIQLEIFWKLSQMANHSIWVGDPKQSIYGFRGAEPALMQAIIEKNGGIRPEDIQQHSWRSREDLVHATNAIFVKAFPDLPEERIALIPKRRIQASADSSNPKDEPIEMGTALMHWHFDHEGGKKTPPGQPWMERCIAKSIRELVDKRIYVNDGDAYRPIQAGDIAVLCRSNKQCLAMAEALHHQGMKAAISRNGLIETPEAKLVLACLKYILNHRDALSIAEINFLASAQSLEAIIDSRLQWMEVKAKDEQYYDRWEAKNEYIKRLDELRPEVSELSAAEILNLILEDLDIRRVVSSWGNTEQRGDNIDMLRLFADKYEDACNRLHTGASLGGFLLWLNELGIKEKDAQGSSEQKDAVNVLTYHRSKGLEWPVVVMHSLENKLRDNLWGAQIVAESDTVDLDNLSENRYIRFWKHPYEKQYNKTHLQINIDNSSAKKRSLQDALEEEARLMYVGITRARDYLIFTSRQKPMNWLNRTWNGMEGETTPTLDPKSLETPWVWKGQTLDIAADSQFLPVTFPFYPQSKQDIPHFAQRHGQQDRKPYYIHYEKENFAAAYHFKHATQTMMGTAFKIIEDVHNFTLFQCLKAFLAYDLPNYSQGDKIAAAERILQRFNLQEEVSYMEIIEHCQAFTQWITDHLHAQNWYKNYPISFIYQNRQFDSSIDLLLEGEDSVAVILHSAYAGNAKKWTQQSAELSDWFFLCQKALESLFPHKNIRLFLHFVLSSGLQEVRITAKSHQGSLSL